MDKKDFDFDSEDDTHRRCDSCSESHHVEYGSTCEDCDVWICKNCENKHRQFHDEARE